MRDLEARDNWIAARIDELMDDAEWFKTICICHSIVGDAIIQSRDQLAFDVAKETAEREHAAIMADLEEERINQHRGHHEF